MAVSDYRQGKWTPKKVSKDFYESSCDTIVDIVRKFYRFFAVDRSDIDGRFRHQVRWVQRRQRRVSNRRELFGSIRNRRLQGVPELRQIFCGNYKPAIQPEWASVGRYRSAAIRISS